MRLVALLLPLSLDTFAVAAALGAAGLNRGERRRVALLFPLFEGAMPLVGVVAGRAVRAWAGGGAEYAAAAALAVVGLLMLRGEDEDAGRLVRVRGAAVLALGLAISLDELAIGAAFGLLGIGIVAAVAVIVAQAIVASQLGLRLGARLSERAREGAERLAGVLLLALAVLFLADRFAR